MPDGPLARIVRVASLGCSHGHPPSTHDDLSGRKVRLYDLLSEENLVFLWASWRHCREQLPAWQRYLSANRLPGLRFVSLAVDAAGPAVAWPYHEAAAATFPTLVDRHNLLGGSLGAHVIPNGLLVNRSGTVVWHETADFRLTTRKIGKSLAGLCAEIRCRRRPPARAEPWRRDLITTHLRLATLLLEQGRKEKAIWKSEPDRRFTMIPTTLFCASESGC